MLRLFYLILFFQQILIAEDKYLAVMNLEPTGLTKQDAEVLTQALISEVVAFNKYVVVERNNIDKILKEQKFQHSGCTNKECAVEIGQLLNADYMLIGSVGKIGSTYTINARIINVATAENVKSSNYTKKGEIDDLVSQGISKVAQELVKGSSRKKNKIFQDLFFTINYNETVIDSIENDTTSYTLDIITFKLLSTVISRKKIENATQLALDDKGQRQRIGIARRLTFVDGNGKKDAVSCQFIERIIDSRGQLLPIDCYREDAFGNNALSVALSKKMKVYVNKPSTIQNARNPRIENRSSQLLYDNIYNGGVETIDCEKIINLISEINDVYIPDCKSGVFIRATK